MGGTSAAAEHRGDARADGFVDLLRADKMNVGIDAAGGDNVTFAGDDFGRGPDDHRVFLFRLRVGVNGANAGLNARVTGVADADDEAVLDADIGFDDTEERIEDEGVRDNEIEAVLVERGGGLTHAVADDFAATEFDFVAVAAALGDEVALDLHEKIGVGETHAVADGGTEHLGVLAAGEVEAHERERGVDFNFFPSFTRRATGLASRRPLILAFRP